jgi:putative hydrolase of the HAD superfamily
MNPAGLDAVTLDAYGTLVTLKDPIPALAAALEARGVSRSQDAIRVGFRAEVAYYSQHSGSGHDEVGLARLQRECADVFLTAVTADLDADEFAPVYAAAMRFEPLLGVGESLQRLRALGLELAVVANWDLSLRSMLEHVGLAEFFTVIVHAARKPAPDGFLTALEALGVNSNRTLHIGDDEVDSEGAAAAGLHFAPAPVPEAVRALT